MTKDQMEVLNIVQQVLRSTLVCIAASEPAKTEALSTTLAAAATNTRLEPQARQMLLDLSQGMNVISSVGKTRQ